MRERALTGAIAVTSAAAVAVLYSAGYEEAAVLAGSAGIAATAAASLRRWLRHFEARLTDSTTERRRLEDETAQSQAAHAAALSLRVQLVTAAAAEEAAREQRLADAVEAVRREFEEVRAAELCEAFEYGARWERSHKKDGSAPDTGNLIYLISRRQPQPDTASATT